MTTRFSFIRGSRVMARRFTRAAFPGHDGSTWSLRDRSATERLPCTTGGHKTDGSRRASLIEAQPDSPGAIGSAVERDVYYTPQPSRRLFNSAWQHARYKPRNRRETEKRERVTEFASLRRPVAYDRICWR